MGFHRATLGNLRPYRLKTRNGKVRILSNLDTKLENSSSPVTARSVLQLMVTDDLIDQYAQAHNITVSQPEIDKIENQIRGKVVPAEMFNEAQKALKEYRANGAKK